MKLTPASRACATMRCAVGSSVGPPKFMVPRHSGETFRPLRPSLRYSMRLLRPVPRLLRGVLTGELRRMGAGEPLLLVLQPGVTRPGALEVVAHADAQLAESFGFQLDLIAVLERAQASMIRAGRQNVAGLERVDRRHPLDAARDLVSHVVAVEVLLQRAVHPQPDLQLV